MRTECRTYKLTLSHSRGIEAILYPILLVVRCRSRSKCFLFILFYIDLPTLNVKHREKVSPYSVFALINFSVVLVDGREQTCLKQSSWTHRNYLRNVSGASSLSRTVSPIMLLPVGMPIRGS